MKWTRQPPCPTLFQHPTIDSSIAWDVQNEYEKIFAQHSARFIVIREKLPQKGHFLPYRPHFFRDISTTIERNSLQSMLKDMFPYVLREYQSIDRQHQAFEVSVYEKPPVTYRWKWPSGGTFSVISPQPLNGFARNKAQTMRLETLITNIYRYVVNMHFLAELSANFSTFSENPTYLHDAECNHTMA